MPRWLEWVAVAGLAALAACAPRTPPGAAPAPGLPRVEPELRVGVLVDTTAVELAASAGLEVVDPNGGRTVVDVAPGATVTLRADEAGMLTYASGADEPIATGASLLVAHPHDGQPISIGDAAYRGSAIVRADGGGRVTAVNQVDMEAYLLGVVPREIGEVGEELLEAAKAQAVAARTYAVRYIGRRESLGFDVFATVQDQVYGGIAAEHDPVSRAVRETAGEIIAYDGRPIEAFYHSTCAGQTAAIEEVWPSEPPRPYLVSVVDVDPATGEAFDRSSNRFEWTQRWTRDEIVSILNRTLADSLPAGVDSLGELRDVEVLERTQSGRIARARIETSSGEYYVGGDRIRWIFRTPEDQLLNSSRFDVEIVRDAEGRLTEVVATGGGWGHGIGMCQVGAMGRARAGQDYRTILHAYFPGTRILQLY